MHGRTFVTGLVVVMLLVGTVPTTALAQSSPRSVLLNEHTSHVGSVTVDGQEYEVYRYENLLWYANGIDIYADGERVTSPERAETVLTALAQRRAVDEIEPKHFDTLRATARAARSTAANASAAAASVNETTAHLEEMKTVRENGTTVYNASVEAAPRIAEFGEETERLPEELRELEGVSTAYAANATELATLLERRENGTDIDPQRLYAQYAETLSLKYQLAGELDSGAVTSDLPAVAGLSESIAANVSSAPRGDETARLFATVHDDATVTANRTAPLEESVTHFEFDTAQERFESLQERWIESWRSRRDAALKVYGSLGFVGAAIFGGVGYVGWRRQ
jgi:hypothetical protein